MPTDRPTLTFGGRPLEWTSDTEAHLPGTGIRITVGPTKCVAWCHSTGDHSPFHPGITRTNPQWALNAIHEEMGGYHAALGKVLGVQRAEDCKAGFALAIKLMSPGLDEDGAALAHTLLEACVGGYLADFTRLADAIVDVRRAER